MKAIVKCANSFIELDYEHHSKYEVELEHVLDNLSEYSNIYYHGDMNYILNLISVCKKIIYCLDDCLYYAKDLLCGFNRLEYPLVVYNNLDIECVNKSDRIYIYYNESVYCVALKVINVEEYIRHMELGFIMYKSNDKLLYVDITDDGYIKFYYHSSAYDDETYELFHADTNISLSRFRRLMLCGI